MPAWVARVVSADQFVREVKDSLAVQVVLEELFSLVLQDFPVARMASVDQYAQGVKDSQVARVDVEAVET